MATANTRMVAPDAVSPVSRALLSIAGAVFGSMSLTLQLADRVENLRAFFKSFKDAPKEVSEMAECLDTLRALLNDIAKSGPIPSPTFKDILKRCDDRIKPLEAIVQKLQPRLASPHAAVQLWARLSTTQQTMQIRKLREALAEAKMDLMIVGQHAQKQQLTTLNETLASLKLGQTTSTPLNSATEGQAKVDAHLDEIKSQVSDLQDNFPEWDKGFQLPMVKHGMNMVVKQVLQAVLGSQELKDLMENLVSNSNSPPDDPDASPNLSKAMHQDEKTNHLFQGFPRSSLVRASESSWSRKWTTWFGTLFYRSRVIRIGFNGEDGENMLPKEIETSWTVVPSAWLLKTAYTYQWAKSTQGWTHQIQTYSIVPRSSQIFVFADNGDVEAIRTLFLAKKASPNDCDDEGYTALHRSAALRKAHVCRFLIQNGANVNAAGFVSGETPLHHVPLNRSRIGSARLFDTVRLLVQAGSNMNLEDKRHQTATAMFESFFKWPSRMALRQVMATCHSWLKGVAWDIDARERAGKESLGKLYNGMDVNSEVEKLDACLKADSPPQKALSDCPRSIAFGWTALHVMMHFRVEPVWHPWSKGSIFQQKDLWSQAMSRAMQHGVDPHAVDLEGYTPTSLALRSLFTFHVWQNAVLSQGYDLLEFADKEISLCAALRRDGWTAESLSYILTVPTETLYLHSSSWREVSEFIAFEDTALDGLYVRSCWFQLLDLLTHKRRLPSGWQTLAHPRQFAKARKIQYWKKDKGMLTETRPEEGKEIDLSSLAQKDLVKEMAQLGVAWQD